MQEQTLFNFLGPIVGVVGQRYGIRAVTFAGGVVASLGAALCCTAPNIIWLAVFWGGIHGKYDIHVFNTNVKASVADKCFKIKNCKNICLISCNYLYFFGLIHVCKMIIKIFLNIQTV